ncbi:glycosyltransferase [Gorillibacterium sp. sgz500922]|uniref:glycosyltransferase n=1 Tax=Gorillibacterium sp. sgz500922 TaxID=3446694 RepID=UPI003F67E124
MNPKVSIVIPFYNCVYVQEAIQSALDQTYPNIEILVVDDGSTEHANLLLPYKKRITLIRKPNGGTGSALNAGIRKSTGDYIAWLSADDRFYPDKISQQMDYMLANQAKISFTDYDLIDEKSQVTDKEVCIKYSTVIHFYRHLLIGNPINGCTVIVSRKLLNKVGLFDESLLFTQDYDLWLRIILAGEDFHYFNVPTVQYRKHDEAGSIRHVDRIYPEIDAVQAHYSKRLEQLIEALVQAGLG